MGTIPMPDYPDHQPRPEHAGRHSVPFAHTCADECTPGTCEVQHDLEFGGPELRAAEKFECETALGYSGYDYDNEKWVVD